MHRQALRHRFERIGLIIGIVLALVTIAAVVNWVIERSDQGPLEPSPEVTEQPTLGPTSPPATATPSIAFDPAPPPEPGSLPHLLTYAPDRLADDSLPLSDIAQYANIQEWMTSRDIETPSEPGGEAWEEWNAELNTLAIPEVLATRGTDSSWVQTYGFGLHQVQQVLAVGSAPDYVLVMRGNFDPDLLTSVWAENGYQAVSVDGITYWSLYPGGSVDLSAPASRPALGNMNNVVILEDGTLIATARSGRLEQTLRTIQGSAPSLATNPQIQNLLAPGTDPQSYVSAVILKGSVLAPVTLAPTVPVVATPMPEPPEAELMVAGIFLPKNHPEQARMRLVTSYGSTEEATSTYTRANRELRSGSPPDADRPHSDRVVPINLQVLATDDGALLMIQLDLVDGPRDWLQIIEERDLGYLMWPKSP